MSAKGSDIKAGAAFVELSVRDGKFQRGLKNAKAALQGFGRTLQLAGGAMAAVGGAITAAMSLSVRSFMDWGDQLDKMSQRTGVARTSLAELAHAAQASGTDLEAVEKAMKEMQKNGLDPRRFDEIADSIAAIQDPTARAQKAMEVWGTKVGTMMLPMLADLQKLRAESRALGGVFDEDQIKLAAELNDAFGRLTTAVKNLMFHVGSALAPAIIQVADAIAYTVGFVADLAREFPIATAVIAGMGIALLAAGTALVAFGTIAAVVIPTVTALIAALDVAALPFYLIAAGVALAVIELMALAAIVAGVVTWFVTCTEAGRKLLDMALKPIYAILEKFQGLGSAISASFGKIAEALKAGDIKTAWEALVLGMKAVWHGFLEGIFKGLADFVEWITTIDPTGDMFGIGAAAEGGLRGLAASQATQREKLEEQVKRLQVKRPGGKDDPNDPNYGLPERSAATIGFNARAALMGRQIIGGGRDEKMLDKMTEIATRADEQLKELLEIKHRIPVRVK